MAERYGQPAWLNATARVPALVEVIVERETDASMGKSIDKINECEPIEEGEQELAQFADNIPKRD